MKKQYQYQTWATRFPKAKAKTKGLTFLQLYRQIKKRGMQYPNLSKEVIKRCGLAPFQILCTFIPKDGREARGINWDSGHRMPKNYRFTEHRQTILLLCAAVNKEFQK